MKKICVVCASVGKNKELASDISNYLKEQKANVIELNLVDMDLPLFTSVNDKIHSAEELMKPYAEHLSADTFVFVAPEYNGSTPPAFNNFLAWASRSTKNWRDLFNGKTAGMATFSGGPGQLVAISMRLQLSYVGMNVLGRQLAVNFQKPLNAESLQAFCNEILKS